MLLGFLGLTRCFCCKPTTCNSKRQNEKSEKCPSRCSVSEGIRSMMYRELVGGSCRISTIFFTLAKKSCLIFVVYE
uniref:Uncharacterized protein n=1 Tax=Physcomitrium patens TaxID=3218 RepID=A0A2K1IUI7_PHYPA|nr:hypothetical protein PHYPA_024879 [Physcomitrium patens]